MLWKLPPSVRSLLPLSSRRYSTHSQLPEPLRILFCGSDKFSITSLRALNEAKQSIPGLIQSVNVVHRPAKPTGRGLKVLKEVPIQRIATEELELDTHVIDTFTGWTPPVPIDLVIAVSFGLLVPPRILGSAKYGGLNVHPSLLPDLSGSSPIQHALLARRNFTGVSVQTLHPTTFDNGTILAQTPSPGVPIPGRTTRRALEEQLAKLGADMLVDVIKSYKFVPPITDAGWYGTSNGPVVHAPKIKKRTHAVDFAKHTMDNILQRQDALEDTWCLLPNGARLLLHEIVATNEIETRGQKPGVYFVRGHEYPHFRAACGGTGIISSCTLAGGKTGNGHVELRRFRSLLPTRSSIIQSAETSES